MTTFGVLSLADHLPDPVHGTLMSSTERFRLVVDQAVWAEQVGFSRILVGEHHFSSYIAPDPDLLLAAMAVRTSTIRLATAVTLLANLDPLRVTESLCTLDVLSAGRAELTVARGVSGSTAEAFGVHPHELRDRFAENLELMLRLLSEEKVTWEGHHRTPLDNVTVQPRPVQQPHPVVWIGGGLSNRSCDLAARLGLPFALPSLFRWPEDYVDIVERYRSRFAHRDGDRGPCVAFPSYVHVARTSQQARARWEPYLMNYVAFATEHRGGGGRPMDYEGLLAGPAVCGSPAEVAEQLARVEELLGLDLHMLMVDAGGMAADLVAETIELLGTEVLPLLNA